MRSSPSPSLSPPTMTETTGQSRLAPTPLHAKLTVLDRFSLILLPNGMEVLLIHDATTDKSSAAMDVRVGHLNDPEDLQGLAHFCEHLMFMGTEKVRPSHVATMNPV